MAGERQGGSDESQEVGSQAPAILPHSTDERGIIEVLEAQHAIQTADLAITGQANERMPDRIRVVESLTKEILERAIRIRDKFGGESQGLLVVDNDRHAKKLAIDANKVPGQKYDTHFYDSDNVDLWNGGEPWTAQRKWEYHITDGQEDIPDDRNISGINYLKTKAWVAKYAKEGLDVLTGADPYLALQRHALSQNKRIDPNFCTVLNTENLTDASLIAYGDWSLAQVYLDYDDPDGVYRSLRVRPSVPVPLNIKR